MKVRKRIGLIILTLAVLAGLGFLLQSDWLRVKEVTCQLENQACSQEQDLAIRDLVLGKNIVFLSTDALEKQILTSETILFQVKIKKVFPQRLEFELKEREPAVALALIPAEDQGKEATDSGLPEFSPADQFLLFDAEGVLLSLVEQTELPLLWVRLLPQLNPGDLLAEEETRQAIRILAKLPFYLVKSQQAELVSSWSLTVWLENQEKVLFSLKKEAEIQLDSLQLIFSRAKIDGRTIKQLDLRFDKPVVIYE